MAARQKTDKELKEKFRRLYGKVPTVMEFQQFKKNHPHTTSFEEETEPNERRTIPILETETDDSVFLDD